MYGAAGLSAAGFLLVAALLLLPQIARTRTSAYLIDEVSALRSGRPVIVVDMKVPSLTYYLGRPPDSIEMGDFERRLDRGDDPLVVFDEVDLPAAAPAALERLREVGRQGKYVVFEKKPPA